MLDFKINSNFSGGRSLQAGVSEVTWLAAVRIAAWLLPVAVQEGGATLAGFGCGLAEAHNLHSPLARLGEHHGLLGLRIVGIVATVSLPIADRLALWVNMHLQIVKEAGELLDLAVQLRKLVLDILHSHFELQLLLVGVFALLIVACLVRVRLVRFTVNVHL